MKFSFLFYLPLFFIFLFFYYFYNFLHIRYVGASERAVSDLFRKARAAAPSIIFFDEIDALGANRSDMNKTSGRTVINQFLNELDGLSSENEGVLILGATNTPWHLDPAFRRPGRFDRIIFVSPPDVEARKAIYTIKLNDKPSEIVDTSDIAKKSEQFSGADINAVIDIAIEQKLTESFKDGILRPLKSSMVLISLLNHPAICTPVPPARNGIKLNRSYNSRQSLSPSPEIIQLFICCVFIPNGIAEKKTILGALPAQ